MTPLILNLGIRWRLVVSITLRPIYSREGPRYQLNRKLVGPHCRSGHFGQEDILLARNGTRTPDRAAVV